MPVRMRYGLNIFQGSILRVAASPKFTLIPRSVRSSKLTMPFIYTTWLEYFNSVVLHNLFFPATAYTFEGFTEIDKELHAVMRQDYIPSDRLADLEAIRELLTNNGFIHQRRQDYYHPGYGFILEDMHDENVLLYRDTLFFIDTVFYTVNPENYHLAK